MEKCYLPQILLTSNPHSLYVAARNIPQSLNLIIANVASFAPVSAIESMEIFSAKFFDRTENLFDVVIKNDYDNETRKNSVKNMIHNSDFRLCQKTTNIKKNDWKSNNGIDFYMNAYWEKEKIQCRRWILGSLFHTRKRRKCCGFVF